MSPAVTQPVLVYNRIAQNRRKTWLLLAVAILSIIPFVGAGSYTVAQIVAPKVSRRSQASFSSYSAYSQFEQVRKALEGSNHYGSADWAEFQRRMEAEKQAREKRIRQEIEENAKFRERIMVLVAAGMVAVLGLLFWALASAPTSRLLAMCGARPAGTSEAEAKRLLENLAIGAGLPTPKLYVIDSSTPNAFAAGMDPARSVVAVTHGLLKLLDRRELEGVLAHELSHIGNRDTRLNTIVATIALFLRLPYLFRQRARRENAQLPYSPSSGFDRFRMYRIVSIPIYLYLFFIAPVLAAVIRAAVSRGREYLADADAALLTRYPEGLIRALSKIRGAGTELPASNPAVSHLYFADPSALSAGIGLFTGNLLATHPPIDQRITRLVEFNGGIPASVIEGAVRAGQAFTRDHPPLVANDVLDTVTRDELSVITMGNPMGRVFRVTGAREPVPMYDRPDLRSPVVARVAPGDLLVVFDDPGKFRQVLTANQTFGYLPLSVKLQRVDMLPSEIGDPVARAAAQSAHEARQAAAASTPAAASAASTPNAASTASAAHAEGASGLTPRQIKIAAVFGVAAFCCFFLVLLTFSGK